MKPEILKALIAATPVLLSPIVVWFLGRPSEAKEKAHIDCLDKRLGLIDRLISMKERSADDQLTQLIDSEIETCMTYLARKPPFLSDIAERERVRSRPVAGGFLHRFFIVAPAHAVRQRVFKGLFYLFFAFSLLGGLGAAIVMSTEGDPDWPYGVIGLLAYMGLALFFRRLARRPREAQPSAAGGPGTAGASPGH